MCSRAHINTPLVKYGEFLLAVLFFGGKKLGFTHGISPSTSTGHCQLL